MCEATDFMKEASSAAEAFVPFPCSEHLLSCLLALGLILPRPPFPLPFPPRDPQGWLQRTESADLPGAPVGQTHGCCTYKTWARLSLVPKHPRQGVCCWWQRPLTISVRVQSLSHCELITDDGIRHLGNGACAHDRLEVIELDNCPLITDASLEHLKSCHSLERIELYDCQQITRAGIKRLRVKIITIIKRSTAGVVTWVLYLVGRGEG